MRKRGKKDAWKICINDNYVAHQFEYEIDPNNSIFEIAVLIDYALRTMKRGGLISRKSEIVHCEQL